MGFLGLFKNDKPVLGMLHLKGETSKERYERCISEFHAYQEQGVDGVIVETYFGEYPDLLRALNYIEKHDNGFVYGVNCLNVDTMGFHAASEFGASFVQIDSVVGHVKPRDEATLEAYFELMRSQYSGYVLGGCRFKYQPLLSKNSLEEDLKIAKRRCDAVCVTENATGQETSLDKIREFKQYLGDFPLIVAAGATPQNIAEAFAYADAAIVGSYFKDTYKDTGELDATHIKTFMDEVNRIRSNQHD